MGNLKRKLMKITSTQVVVGDIKALTYNQIQQKPKTQGNNYVYIYKNLMSSCKEINPPWF